MRGDGVVLLRAVVAGELHLRVVGKGYLSRQR